MGRHDPRHQRRDRLGVADVAHLVRRTRHRLDLGPRAGHHRRAGLEERLEVMPRPIPRAPPVTSTTRPDRSIVRGMADTLPSTCLVRSQDCADHLHAAPGRHPGHHDGPPAGQRAHRAGLVRRRRPRSTRPAPTRRPKVVILRAEGKGFNAGVDIKEMQHTDGLRRPARRQQGLLRGVQGGLRVRGAGHRRRQRLLPRRRRRPGRQRRHRRGQRRRLLRRPRGRPGRARRRHPPGPAGAPAPDAHALLHRPHDHRAADLVPHGSRARGGPARPARRRRPRGSPARSPTRTPASSGPPRRRSTASTRSTSTRATGSSRASPSSST